VQKLRKIEKSLIDGTWFDETKGTNVWAIVAASVVSAGVGLYTGIQQGKAANSQLTIEENQEGKQNDAWSQLQTLMNNPSSFFNSPVYTAAANQGGAQVSRQMAAGGFRDSGNEATALQAYGQSFGQQQFLSQEQLLAGMTGTGFNPSTAASGASSAFGAAGNSGQQLAGMLAFLGSSGTTSSGSGNPSAGFTGTDLNPVTVGDGGVVAE
jgi:hypothetical protein